MCQILSFSSSRASYALGLRYTSAWWTHSIAGREETNNLAECFRYRAGCWRQVWRARHTAPAAQLPYHRHCCTGTAELDGSLPQMGPTEFRVDLPRRHSAVPLPHIDAESMPCSVLLCHLFACLYRSLLLARTQHALLAELRAHLTLLDVLDEVEHGVCVELRERDAERDGKWEKDRARRSACPAGWSFIHLVGFLGGQVRGVQIRQQEQQCASPATPCPSRSPTAAAAPQMQRGLSVSSVSATASAAPLPPSSGSSAASLSSWGVLLQSAAEWNTPLQLRPLIRVDEFALYKLIVNPPEEVRQKIAQLRQQQQQQQPQQSQQQKQKQTQQYPAAFDSNAPPSSEAGNGSSPAFASGAALPRPPSVPAAPPSLADVRSQLHSIPMVVFVGDVRTRAVVSLRACFAHIIRPAHLAHTVAELTALEEQDARAVALRRHAAQRADQQRQRGRDQQADSETPPAPPSDHQTPPATNLSPPSLGPTSPCDPPAASCGQSADRAASSTSMAGAGADAARPTEDESAATETRNGTAAGAVSAAAAPGSSRSPLVSLSVPFLSPGDRLGELELFRVAAARIEEGRRRALFEQRHANNPARRYRPPVTSYVRTFPI